ncbi:MFS transporter [Streptomyces purpurascens]|uniref:MFS transporter n=1 Tax=Streptomyces purpurascens TaxID=1924 RepID=UPI0034079815
MAPIVLAFAALDATGSVGSLSLVVGAHSLTCILFLLFGGVLADLLPRGPLLGGSSGVSAASQAVIAVLVLTDSAAIPPLMVLAAVNGASSSCYQPAAQSLLSQSVQAESRRAALALSRIAGSSAMIVGAPLGGVLVAAVGPGWGLALDLLSFTLAAASFALVRVQVAPPEPSHGVVHELRVGWQEFTSRSWVWVIVVAFCFLNAGLTASFTVLGPAVADTTGIGRSGWGLALAAGSLGAVAGGVVSPRWRPRRAILVGCGLMGLTAMIPLLLALAPYTWVLVVANFVAGVGIEQAGVAWYSTLNEQIPENRLARVSPTTTSAPTSRSRWPSLPPDPPFSSSASTSPSTRCRAHPPRRPRNGRHPLHPRAGSEGRRTAARLPTPRAGGTPPGHSSDVYLSVVYSSALHQAVNLALSRGGVSEA